jgi:hypothetical protein
MRREPQEAHEMSDLKYVKPERISLRKHPEMNKKNGYPPDKQEKATALVLEQTEVLSQVCDIA